MKADMHVNQVSRPVTAARPPFAAMFLRSFFIQAGWNYERNQNIGFAFALLPALRRVYGSTERFYSALLRNLEFFNTQPYMAGFILGNVAKMEEKLSAGPETAETIKIVSGVKQALASSFASIGDRIFWGRLKPMTTQLCLIVWTLGGFYGWLFTSRAEYPPVWLIMLGPVSGAAVYSLFSIYWRWKGLRAGFECGGTSNCGLDAMEWPRFIRRLSVLCFSFSVIITLAAFGLFIGLDCYGRPLPEIGFRLLLPLSVLAVHRAVHKLGYSIFWVIGLILLASLSLFFALGAGALNL